MRLTRKVHDPPHKLQDLLDDCPRIRQSDLTEFIDALDALQVAREDVENLAAVITEMLILKFPLEQGRFEARFVDGKLHVHPREE